MREGYNNLHIVTVDGLDRIYEDGGILYEDGVITEDTSILVEDTSILVYADRKSVV